MLIEMIRNSYREVTGHLSPAEPVTRVRNNRPAANADSFSQAEMQARRHRRQRRMERNAHRGLNGWTVRAW